MHQEIRYTGSQAQKDAAAIKDLKKWLGRKRYAEFADYVRKTPDLDSVYMLAGIAGVSGLPVTALVRKCGGPELLAQLEAEAKGGSGNE